jgi:hypothetical protein
MLVQRELVMVVRRMPPKQARRAPLDEEGSSGMSEQQAATYPKHNCFAWNVQHYHSRPDCVYSCCGICGRITGFRWRKMWHRIRSLFTDKQIQKLGRNYDE